MHDPVDDVDDECNRSGGARTSNDVRARHNTIRIGRLLEERPRHAGLVHRVEVDHQVTRPAVLDVHRQLLYKLRLMLRVRSTISSSDRA